MFAQRTLGSPGGKHSKSLERNIWRKLVSPSKKAILGRDQRYFALVLSQMDLENINTWKNVSFCLRNLEICDKIDR